MAVRRLAASLSLVVIVPLVGLAGLGASPAHAAVTPVANPQIEEKCGLPITLVLDASGSIQSSNAVNKVRDAAEAFLDALSNTNSSVRVTQFATLTQQLAPSTVVDDNSLGAGGVHRKAINGYYNPKPPRPADVDFYQCRQRNFQAQQQQQQRPVHQLGRVPAPGGRDHAREARPRGLHHRRRPDGVRLRQARRSGLPGPPPDVGFGTDSTSAQAPDHPRPGRRGGQQGQEPTARGCSRSGSAPP